MAEYSHCCYLKKYGDQGQPWSTFLSLDEKSQLLCSTEERQRFGIFKVENIFQLMAVFLQYYVHDNGVSPLKTLVHTQYYFTADSEGLTREALPHLPLPPM